MPDPRLVAEWINLNAFAARLTNLGLAKWTAFAIIEIRSALEEENPDPAVLEQRVIIASQWILLSGKRLFKDAFAANTLSLFEIKVLAPGTLYTGRRHPGVSLSMARWWFWLKRFKELALGLKGDSRAAADQAAVRMKSIVEEDGRVEVRHLGRSGD